MIKFDKQYHLYDITPLENMFIQQYLVKSPGDYVKVYIYCLNLCYYPDGNDVTTDYIAQVLKLGNEEVDRALRYWSRLGVMTVTDNDGNIEIEMHSMKDMFLKCDFSDDVDLYKYADFNNALSEAFMPRILDTQDYLLYQDMMNIFDVSEEYVIEAVKHSIKSAKTVDIPYKYVEKVIEAWKSDNISDVAALKKYLEKKNSIYVEVTSILRYLGMNRAPTVPEINCYKKWIDEYKFTFDAVKEACNSTLSANNPTMKYLDTILTGLYEKNVSTPSEISAKKEDVENYRSKLRKLMFYMGIQGAPSQIQTQKYKKWESAYGYTEEDITVAASLISDTQNPFEALDSMLESFFMNGIKNAEEMLNYITEKQAFDALIKAVYNTLGVNAVVSEKERQYMRTWRDKLSMSEDVILFAAGCAKTADKPWQYMNKIITIWHDAGIKTVEAAKIQNDYKFAQNKSPNSNGKKYSFADIDKRDNLELDDMFDDFSKQ